MFVKMKKNSYRSAPPSKEREPLRSGELPSVPEATVEYGHGSLVSPGEQVMPPTHSKNEDEPFYTSSQNKTERVNYNDMLEMLLLIADEKDRTDDIVEADFADFLIKKFAEQKDFNHSIFLKDLMVKILESDLTFYNEIIKDLTSYFNRLIILYVEAGDTLSDAKRKAYRKVSLRAKKYVS